MEYAAWGAAGVLGALTGYIFVMAYLLHMENDRADGPCAVHRFLRKILGR